MGKSDSSDSDHGSGSTVKKFMKPSDWWSWNSGFENCLLTNQLYEYFRLDKDFNNLEKLLEKPREPDITTFPRATKSQPSGATSSSSSTADLDLGPPTSYAELSDSGKNDYKFAIQCYKDKKEEWMAQQKALKNANDYIQKTVAYEFKQSCCQASVPLPKQYRNLSEFQPEEGEKEAIARDIYNKIWSSYYKCKTKDEYKDWIVMWQRRMTECKNMGLYEASTRTWATHLQERTNKSFPNFAAVAIKYKSTTSWSEVVSDFRAIVTSTYMPRDNNNNRRGGRQGADGAAMAAQRASRGGRGGRGGGRGGKQDDGSSRGTKREADDDGDDSNVKKLRKRDGCYACGAEDGHPYPECFYLYYLAGVTDRIPYSNWKPNRDRLAKAKEWIEKHSNKWEELKKEFKAGKDEKKESEQ